MHHYEHETAKKYTTLKNSVINVNGLINPKNALIPKK